MIKILVYTDTSVREIDAWVGENTYGQPVIEESALKQLKNIAAMSVVHKVCAMPDVHAGIGATVGSVIATKKAIIPAAVGVDIGCGMMAVKLSGATENDVDEAKLHQVFTEIEHTVPTGFGRHESGQHNITKTQELYTSFKWLEEKHKDAFKRRKDDPYTIIASQFGSLGGGNHFIELCRDQNGDLWLMLHSGSRGIGNVIGQFFIERAKEEMIRQGVHLVDRDLSYLTENTENFNDYWNAVMWAQEYAHENRNEMMRRILIVLHRHLPPFKERDVAVNCHHNYVEKEVHFNEEVYVTRKGAIRAGKGELGIIPGSMGQRSYIVEGLGSADSLQSCSHGAGRVMSRSAAKKHFTVADLVEQTEGVVCRKDAGVLDEIPGAYKNIDEVMANQTDLVRPLFTLKQLLCVKGTK